MAENKEVWEDWAAESLPDVNVSEGNEMPSWYGNPVETHETTGEIRNPDNDVYSRISRLVGKIKNVPGVMSYYAHKVADPMYANVDYMGQQVGDWAAKKVNNIARAFDISPEARQYGRFEEEEYDPENVDVRFGKNAYKEGYDNLGDYLEARDQEKVDRYRGYNHANRFAPIESADENFYNLSDTQTMEDWKPETVGGKVAKGAIETAGNMLPESLKALAEEKSIVGGTKMLGMLSPLGKKYLQAKRNAAEYTDLGEMSNARNELRNADNIARAARNANAEGELLTTQQQTPLGWEHSAKQRADLVRKYRKARGLKPVSKQGFMDQVDDLRYAPESQRKFMAQKINEARAKNWKPMPNPTAQRDAAMASKLSNFETPETLAKDVKRYLMSRDGVVMPEGFTKADFDDVVGYLTRPKNTALTWEPELGAEELVNEFNEIARVYKQERPWFERFTNVGPGMGAKMLEDVGAEMFPPSVSPNGWISKMPDGAMPMMASEIADMIRNGEIITKDQVYMVMEMIKDSIAEDLGAVL